MKSENLTVIDIVYNRLRPSMEIKINGKDISKSSKLNKYKRVPLQSCMSELIELLPKEINEDEFKLIFTGEEMDFNDLKEFCKENPNIQLVHQQNEESEKQPIALQNKIDQLTELVDFMQTGPIKELRSKKIRDHYERAINSEFEIAVVATMSSGKSTLINAILGSDIIPSKNMACTAKISKIRNVNDQPIFSVKAYDKANKLIEEHEVATPDILNTFNKNKDIHMTCVEGKLPNIQCDAMNLTLIDTPGPNNSQDASHNEKTMEIIKNDEYKPLVLYILNATQLGINDDQKLLKLIRDEMKAGDKQTKDRFIFVLNKIDEFDLEKESVEDAIVAARQYLENNEIENPKIFPASAHLAKNIRKYLNGIELTRREKGSLVDDVEYFIETTELHLLDYTPLSDSQKEKLRQDLQRFKEMGSDEGDYLQALYHTGIPYIEEAINEYLNKYAITFKLQEAIGSFQRIIDKQNLERKILNELENSVRNVENSIRKINDNKESLVNEKDRIQSNTQQINESKEKISNSSKQLQDNQLQLKETQKDLEQVDNSTQSLNQNIQAMERELLKKEKEAEALKEILNNYDSNKFKEKVNALDINSYMLTRPIRGKIEERLLRLTREFREKGKMRRHEAEESIAKLDSDLRFLVSDIKTDLERVFESSVKHTVVNLMDDYQKEIKGLFIDNDSIDLNSSSVNFIMASVPTGKELVKEYSYKEEVAVGTERVKNSDKKWYKPWTWIESSYYNRTIYETQEFVDLSALMNEYIKVIHDNLTDNMNNVTEAIEQQIENIKVDFNEKVNKFENIIKEEANKYEQMIQDFKISQQRKLEEEEKLSAYQAEQEKLAEEKKKLEDLTKQLETDSQHLRQNRDRLTEENKKLAVEIKKREKNLIKLETKYSRVIKQQEVSQEKKEFLDKINEKLKLIMEDEVSLNSN